ncbi:permease prefix domain 1-containing protein [Peribacillus sp. SCS-26]|uniref:permease prefix domain 1-containing protein n=1 Tax=Paraperibacillus marinus TaxID=3115295 RepID=UPI0039062CB4
MNREIESYLDAVVSGLNMSEDEKTEFREELSVHLEDHISELLVKGFSEEEAVRTALSSFGNEKKLNRELKKTLFPFYKLIRYAWCVALVTGFLCLLSYSAMEYYEPRNDNSLPAESVITGMFIIAILSGIAEVLFEALQAEYKSKWLTNPLSFFLIPAFLIGCLTSISLVQEPEKYQDGLWLDLYAIPLGAIAHLTGRQLFSLVFMRRKKLASKKNAK